MKKKKKLESSRLLKKPSNINISGDSMEVIALEASKNVKERMTALQRKSTVASY